MMADKLDTSHQQRKAVVYLRQSSPQQLVHCRESTDRQYALARRAADLGWPAQRIEIIDEDLGKSGSGTAWRAGFQSLARQVADGQVGAVLALEVSRFARSSTDWHHLLDLCGWAGTLIVDEDAIYDPRDPNDRLLLGLKGQMSEAERYWMRLRLQGGKLNKARRGAYWLRAPIGYVWDDDAERLGLDPDEAVRDAVSLAFKRFRLDGSAYGVVRYFARNGLQMPRRPPGGALTWGRPTVQAVERMLHNPIYTGAYVYARRASRPIVRDGRLVGYKIEPLPMESWKVLLRDRHPAYLSWDDYMANQRRLDENRGDFGLPLRRGAPRNGAALLQGRVLCGLCGARMHVAYAGQQRRPQYICRSPSDHGEKRSWSILANRLDGAVVEQFLAAASPPEVELSLAVGREAERQSDELARQWRHRLETAAYEARLAERRYMAVDPENRTVARTLERSWEDKLREKEELERAFGRAAEDKGVVLGPAERARVFALARDLRAVWHAASTTDEQRKNLLRTLITEIAIRPVDATRSAVHVEILWETGAVQRLDVPLRPRIYPLDEPLRDTLEALMREGVTDARMAEILNTRGVPNGRDTPWNTEMVCRTRARSGLVRAQIPDLPTRGPRKNADGLYSGRGAAERLGISMRQVQALEARGVLRRVQGAEQSRYSRWYRLDDHDVERVHQALDEAPTRREKEPEIRADGLLSARGVAARLGVSTACVRGWVQAGALQPAEGGGYGRSFWFRLREEDIGRLIPAAEAFKARQKNSHVKKPAR